MTTSAVELTRPSARVSDAMASVKKMLPTIALYGASLAVALGLCALLVSVTGGSARAVFSALLDGSIRSPGAWGLTISTATPLLMVAAGSIVCSKAGLTNIGQEGQLLLGAAATAYVATRLDAPGPVLLLVAFTAGAAIGALWSGIAAVMRFTRQVPEVISTLLLVFIAFQLTNFALTKPWLLLNRSGAASTTNSGDPLPASAQLPMIHVFGNDISSGVILALLMTAAVSVVLGRTTWGFRLRMLGMNPRTAHRAGVSLSLYGGAAMAVTGAFAGIAGSAWLTGGISSDRFTSGMSSNLGWQGLLVALLARERAGAAIPMAFVFAMLRTGAGFLSATGVERRIADVVQAMLVLALLVPPALLAVQRRRRSTGAPA
jgi:simple sugar transport system permease protein